MEDAVIVLAMLFIIVIASFMLDRYSCMVISQSGFALMFGLLCGLIIVGTGKNSSLEKHMNLDNNLFFDVLLPPIIYDGGFSIKRQAFFRNFPAIMSTAVAGTAIATIVTGLALLLAGKYGYVTEISWVEAFLFGSLISAVDPVATLGCFNKLNAPPMLFNLVFGESVLNDAVAIALYQTLARWKSDTQLNIQQLSLVALNTFVMFAGSLVVSLVITMTGAFLLNRQMFATLRFFPTYEISLCLIFSLMTYFVADSLNLSGIVALFFSGTMTAHYHFHTISKEAQHSFTHLLHTLAFICENFVYVFMGTSVVLIFTGHMGKGETSLHMATLDWKFIGITMVACLVARFFNIFPLLGLSNCFRSQHEHISVKFMTAIWFAGLRGSIAFALAKNWSYIGPGGVSHRELIESTTLMVVIFTTIVIGGLTGPLLKALGLTFCVPKGNEKEYAHSDTSSSMSDNISPPLHRTKILSPRRGVNRRSSHFVCSSSNSDRTPNFTVAIDLADLPSEAVLTPRPQFRDGAEIDAIEELPQLSASRPRINREESLTGVVFRRWQHFDASYLQPMFGGSSQSHAANQRSIQESMKVGEQHIL
jgi:sodium/hydrogen exchanger 8